jgi:hypothetical protein
VPDNFAMTNCSDVECPEESGLELQMHSEGLPWASILVESGTKELVETRGATVVLGCYLTDTSTLESGTTTCSGNWNPEAKNGTGNVAQVASTLLFTGMTDRLECSTGSAEPEPGESGFKTEGIPEKQLSMMAYGSPVPTKKVNPLTTNTKQGTLESKGRNEHDTGNGPMSEGRKGAADLCPRPHVCLRSETQSVRGRRFRLVRRVRLC